jgi:hypothetical protein
MEFKKNVYCGAILAQVPKTITISVSGTNKDGTTGSNYRSCCLPKTIFVPERSIIRKIIKAVILSGRKMTRA